jgi:hypothetical protein
MRIRRIRVQEGPPSSRWERPASGKCNFPLWAAIDTAGHIRICGNPLEAAIPAEVAK